VTKLVALATPASLWIKLWSVRAHRRLADPNDIALRIPRVRKDSYLGCR
jgi:hypothetical protein